MEICKDKVAMKLIITQLSYLDRVVKRFQLDVTKSVTVPSASHLKFSKLQSSKTDTELVVQGEFKIVIYFFIWDYTWLREWFVIFGDSSLPQEDFHLKLGLTFICKSQTYMWLSFIFASLFVSSVDFPLLFSFFVARLRLNKAESSSPSIQQLLILSLTAAKIIKSESFEFLSSSLSGTFLLSHLLSWVFFC